MTLGVRDYIGTINKGDTAELTAFLRINEQPVTQDQILTVTFTVQAPDGTTSTVTGIVEPDGSGFCRWTTTTQVGEYLVQARFVLGSGEVRSVMDNFTVIDPFEPPVPTDLDIIVEQVELRLEDIFDSIEGGPWLRDRTKAHFDAGKIAAFVNEALLDINVEMPPTTYTLKDFTQPINGQPNPNLPILVKGVLVLIIRHLMRSYVEQPIPQGGQVVWQDRSRYTQMWTQVYQVEAQDFLQKLRLWKRTGLALGHSALLTSSKAGRLFPYGGSQRMRNAGRGYF